MQASAMTQKVAMAGSSLTVSTPQCVLLSRANPECGCMHCCKHALKRPETEVGPWPVLATSRPARKRQRAGARQDLCSTALRATPLTHASANPAGGGAASAPPSRPTRSKKIDINKQGLSSVKNSVVKKNLMGVSESMSKKDWKDSQGRKGKGFGVYRFANKYGANVDGYSPIYTPDVWSETGNEYKLGTKGLLAWAGLVTVLLGVGLNLVISTSALGQ